MSDQPIVVIAGATGFLGSRLARLLARSGVTVAAVGRDLERLNSLFSTPSDGAEPIHTYRADLTNPDQAGTVAAQLVDELDAPHAAIAALGGWYVEDETIDVSIGLWESTLRANLTTHFVSAKAFAPILGGTDPVYITLNGIASHYPCVGSVAVSVAGAGQRMLIDVLSAEAIGRTVRFHELVINTPVVEPGQTHDTDEPTHTTVQVCEALRSMIDNKDLRGTARVELN